jgi:two-component system, chemotaxis family, chemotaxis protein CheY
MNMTTRRTILVVEDDQDVCESVCDSLLDAGYAVAKASNGEVALRALEAPNALPGLVLLDLMMPVIDGERFLKEMRKDPRLSTLPVVLLTADRRATDQAIALGANHGLRKPVHLNDLIATVSKYCQDR